VIFALLSLALAAIPEGLRPAAAPFDAPARYQAEFPGKSPLACAPLLPKQALLCFRVWEGGRRRWVTERDLARWRTDLDGLVAGVKSGAEEVLKTEPGRVSVVDFDGHYFELRDGDGWAAAPLLRPDLLASKLGQGSFRVAIPRAGVFLAWPTGSADLDKIMAVAVRELYESGQDAVTPMVFRAEGEGFVAFGQAKATGG